MARNSKLILCKNIKMDRQYKNVVNLSEANMLALCRSSGIYITEQSNLSIIKHNKELKVNISYENCLKGNYIAFQNPTYSNKWFFAWIDEVEYISNECTRITFTIDSYSTFHNQITSKACYVIREHVTDDTIGLHTIDENIDIGEVIQEAGTLDALYTSTYGYWVGVTSSYIPAHTENEEDSVPAKQFDGVTIYNKTVFGKQLILFKITDVSAYVNVALYLLHCNADNHIGDVQDMFILPNLAVNELTVTYCEANIGGHDYDFYFPAMSDSPRTFNTTINKRHSFTGLTVRNNKCFVYPYNYLLVSNNQGSHNIYKYEDFSTTSCVFENQFAVSIGGSGRLVPKDYKGMTTADDDTLPLGKYPTCGWSADSYLNWLSANAITMPVKLANLGASVLSPKNLTLNGAMSTASEIASVMNEFREAKCSPNIEGSTAIGDVIFSADRNCFIFHEMRCKNEYMKQIDDYFYRFGYKVNTIKIPNMSHRQNFNYVEIGSDEEIGYGEVPSKYMEEINNAFRKGITIWNNHTNLGNFSVSNNIVS